MIADKLKNHANKLKNYDIQINVLKSVFYIIGFKENKITSVFPKEKIDSYVKVYDKEGRLSVIKKDGVLSIDDLLKSEKMTKMGFKDEFYKCLPPRGRYEKIKGLFDKKMESIIINNNIEYMIGNAQNAINSSLEYDSKIKRVHGELEYKIRKKSIFNNSGVECNSKHTICSIQLENESLDGSENGYGLEEQQQRYISDLNIKGVSEKAASLARDLLGAKKPKEVELSNVPVILTPSSFNTMVVDSIKKMIDGEEIIMGNSYLTNKLDSKIAGENLTIIDNPHVYKGTNSISFDSEGVPTKNKAIIKKGVLKTYLLDWYTSQRMNMDVFGFKQGFRNIQVKQTSNLDDMLDLKEYVILDYFYDTANVSTAEINGMSTGMRHYKNGKYTPLKQINVASNVLNIISNIIDISEPEPLVDKGSKIPKAVLIKKGIIKFS